MFIKTLFKLLLSTLKASICEKATELAAVIIWKTAVLKVVCVITVVVYDDLNVIG